MSSLQAVQGLTPFELVQISVAGPMNIFLNGPAPAAVGVDPVTNGFKWVSYLYQQGANNLNPSAPVTIQLTGPGKRAASRKKRTPDTVATVLLRHPAAH